MGIKEPIRPVRSRLCPADQYAVGKNPPSFDKQFVRDWLESTGWDKNPPAPELPPDVVAKTSEKYIAAYRQLTGREYGWGQALPSYFPTGGRKVRRKGLPQSHGLDQHRARNRPAAAP